FDLIEIKSGTGAKQEHSHDLSFQKYVVERCGYDVRKCFVLHIDNKYVKKGDINPEELLKLTDVTSDVTKVSEGIEDRIKKMIEVIDMNTCPPITVEDLLSIKHSTFIIDEFLAGLPANNVFTLYGCRTDKKYEFWTSGYERLSDLPDEVLNPKQKIQKKCAASNETHIDREGIKDFLDTLEYPIYHLDFESINPAIPLFDGTRPYQQIPFQYSLHIEQSDGDIDHKEFLHDGSTDPRRPLTERLIKDLGTKGSILTYNESFEKKVLRGLAKDFPEYSEAIDSFLQRIRDLIKPFKNFHYHDPRQKSSCSIKDVLPIFSDLDYKGLDISNGENASQAFISLMEGKDKKPERTRKALLEYCKLDTYSMVIILDKLRKLADR
ncbi:MAG: DUF2779 domain-containing protein, partial [Candidatus Woesearchaeota archaeon]